MARRQGKSQPLAYAAQLAVAVVLAAGFVAVAPRLAALGLSAPLFYVVLVPLGLAAAAFLYRALDATEQGSEIQARFWFGSVKLGGPVAVAALVVGGGVYVLQRGPPRAPLALVVRVAPEQRDVDLTRATDLVVLMGQRRFPPDLVIPTEAHFPLEPEARQQPLQLAGRIPGHELDGRPFAYPADGVLVLPVHSQRTLMTGKVIGPDDAPLDGATVVFDGATEVETAGGAFRAVLDHPPGDVRVEVRYHGRVGYSRTLTTPGDVTLRWSPP